MLAGLRHGKLVNFKSEMVESEFFSTQLTTDKRKRLDFDTDNVSGHDPATDQFVELATEVLMKWGGFLSVDLYREAIVHQFGGSGHVIQPIDIRDAGRVLGTQ